MQTPSNLTPEDYNLIRDVLRAHRLKQERLIDWDSNAVQKALSKAQTATIIEQIGSITNLLNKLP